MNVTKVIAWRVFEGYVGLATKGLRDSSLGGIVKIRNRLVVNQLNVVRLLLANLLCDYYYTIRRNIVEQWLFYLSLIANRVNLSYWYFLVWLERRFLAYNGALPVLSEPKDTGFSLKLGFLRLNFEFMLVATRLHEVIICNVFCNVDNTRVSNTSRIMIFASSFGRFYIIIFIIIQALFSRDEKPQNNVEIVIIHGTV